MSASEARRFAVRGTWGRTRAFWLVTQVAGRVAEVECGNGTWIRCRINGVTQELVTTDPANPAREIAAPAYAYYRILTAPSHPG